MSTDASNMLVKLIHHMPDHPAQEFPVRGVDLTLGSADKCSVVLANTEVAPLHATVEVSTGLPYVRLNAAGRLLAVNGQRVNKFSPLAHGDRVQVGPYSFVVFVGPAPQGSSRKPARERKEARGRALFQSFKARMGRPQGKVLAVACVLLLLGAAIWFLPNAFRSNGFDDPPDLALKMEAATEAFETQNWDKCIEVLTSLPSTHSRANTASRILEVAKQERENAATARRVVALIGAGRWVEAWSDYEQIPVSSLTFEDLRESLLKHVRVFARAFVDAGVAAIQAGNEALGRSHFARAQMFVPSIVIPDVEIEEDATPTPLPRAPAPPPSPRRRAASRFERGDLSGAIKILENALKRTRSEDEKRKTIKMLEEYRQIEEIRARGERYLSEGREKQAFMMMEEATRRANRWDKRARSPVTRALRSKALELCLKLSQAEMQKKTRDGYKAARNYLDKGNNAVPGNKEIRKRLSELDQGPAADCYRQVYARFRASPLILDHSWAKMTLLQCMDLSARGFEYHDKSRALLAKLEDSPKN